MATKLKLPPRPPKLPLVLQRLSTDEWTPVPYSPLDRRILAQVRAQGPKFATRLSQSLGDYWSSRQGAAAALHSLDEAWGGGFYNVPAEASLDREAADAALGGEQLVIDVQTHYVADRPGAMNFTNEFILGIAEAVASDRFKGLDKLVRTQHQAGFSFAEYLRCVFLEGGTDVAVLTSGPGVEGKDPIRNVSNPEMVGTRELIERLGGTGRLINPLYRPPQRSRGN